MSDSQDIFQATHIFLSYLKVGKFIKPLHHRLRDFCRHLFTQSFIRLKVFLKDICKHVYKSIYRTC